MKVQAPLQPALMTGPVIVATRIRPQPCVPDWVAGLVRGAAEQTLHLDLRGRPNAGTLVVQAGGPFTMVSARLPRADTLDAAELRSATTRLYRAIREALTATAAPHPVRMWNFIPGIHELLAEGIDRYQVFNMGRYEGFSEWFGGAERFPQLLPTATGVGHAGHALLVFALGASEAGQPVENTRQRPAFRYSRRYGPRPPCFARATRAEFPGGRRLLIGGTSSVRGEDSVHEGSLPGQLAETFENLRSLLDGPAGFGAVRGARVYHRRSTDSERIREDVSKRLPGVPVDLVQADICRRELLVELEAIAELASD